MVKYKKYQLLSLKIKYVLTQNSCGYREFNENPKRFTRVKIIQKNKAYEKMPYI